MVTNTDPDFMRYGARRELQLGEPMDRLYGIFDVYNHLKERRDTLRAIKEAVERAHDGVGFSEVADLIEAEAQWLTLVLASIDRGLDRPTEEDEAA